MTQPTSPSCWQSDDVLRWHSNPDPRLRLSGDTVRAHSLRVRGLCHSLAAFIGHPIHDSNLLNAALWHDNAERITGDWPGPFCADPEVRAFKEAQEHKAHLILRTPHYHADGGFRLSAKEDAMLDLCDKLDALQWSIRCDVSGPEWDDMAARIRVMGMALDCAEWVEEQIDAVAA